MLQFPGRVLQSRGILRLPRGVLKVAELKTVTLGEVIVEIVGEIGLDHVSTTSLWLRITCVNVAGPRQAPLFFIYFD